MKVVDEVTVVYLNSGNKIESILFYWQVLLSRVYGFQKLPFQKHHYEDINAKLKVLYVRI